VKTNRAERNFNASMRLLKKVGASCSTLPALSELKTISELTARARIVRSALNARALFENFQKNLSGLNDALADYRTRKQQIAEDHAQYDVVSADKSDPSR
jgi:hypothetical protein